MIVDDVVVAVEVVEEVDSGDVDTVVVSEDATEDVAVDDVFVVMGAMIAAVQTLETVG